MIGYHCLQKVVLSLRPDAVPNFTKEEEQDLFEARDLLLDNGLQQLLGKIVVNHPDWLSSLSLEQRAPLDALQNPQQPSEAEEKRSLSALEEIQLFIRLSGSVYDKTKYANEQELATNLVRLFGNLNNVVLYLQRSSNGQKNFKARVVFKLPSSEEWQPDLWRIFLLSRTDSCWAAQFINQIGMIEANLDGTELKKLTQDDVLKAVARVKYGREKADRNMELALLCYCYDVNQKAFMIALNTELKSHDILPDIAIDGRDLGYPGFYFVKMQPGDLRGFVLGEMTACCQSVGGYGQWCALHGMTSENGGFYILCKGGLENKSPKDKIVAQTWAWLSKAGSLVCDSWEGFKDNCGGEEGYAAICADFLSAAACEVGRRNYTGLRLGTDGQTPPKGLPFKAPKADIPLDHQGCPDSAEQYLIVPSAYYIARLEDLYADRINIIMVVVHYAKLVAEYSADKKQDVARYKEILCKIDDDSDLKEKLNPAGQMVLERAIAGEGDKSENEALVYLTKDAYREIEEAFSGKMDNYLDNFEFHEGIGKGLEKFKQVCVQALKYSSTALALLYDSRLRKLLDDVRIEKIAKRYNLYLNSCKREVFLLAHDEVAIALIKKPDLRADVNGRCPVAIEVFAQAALKEGSVRVAQALYEDTNLWGMATNESKRNISLTHAEIFLQMLQDKREDFSNHYFSDIVAFYALAQGEIRAQILKYVAGNADLVKRLNYAAKLLLFNAISQFNGVNVAGDISVEYKRQCSRGFFIAEEELDALGYLAREAYDVMQENVRKNDLSLGDVYSSSRKDSIIEKFSPIYCYAEEHASAALSLLYDANLSSLLDASELRDSFSRKELGVLHEEVALEFIANSALRSGGRVARSICISDLHEMAISEGRSDRVAMALYADQTLFEQLTVQQKMNLATRFEAFRGAIIDDGSFQEIFNSFTRKQQWELIQNSCCKVIARLQETGGLFQWLRKMQSAELSWLRKNNFVFVLTALWKNEKLLEWVLTLSVGHINDCVEGFVAAIEEEADGIQKSMLMELYRSQKLIGKLYVCVVDSMQNKLFSVAKADADIAFQCGEVALMRENKTGARSFFLSAFAQGYDRDEVYTKLLACDDDLFEAAEAIYGSETFSEFQDRAETDVDAMLICGNCRLFGAGGVVKDLSEALKYFYAAQAGGLSTVAWDLDAAHFTLLDDVITPLTRSRKGICFFSRFDANGVGLNPCRVALTALHEKKKALRSSNGGSPYEQLSQEVKRQIAVLKEVEGDHKICAKNLAATLTLALSTKGLPVASETENSADIPRFGP